MLKATIVVMIVIVWLLKEMMGQVIKIWFQEYTFWFSELKLSLSN